MDRRTFVKVLSGGTVALAGGIGTRAWAQAGAPEAGQGIVDYVQAVSGKWDQQLFLKILGSANAFKEGDATVGVGAASEKERAFARQVLLATRLREIDEHPPLADNLTKALQASLDPKVQAKIADWTFADLKQFLLTRDQAAIDEIIPGLSSHVIGCAPKLMTDEELIAISSKLFHPMPGSSVGARGYLSARLQPNSTTDSVEDVRWQVFDGWSYGVGDFLLGNNPVSSEPEKVKEVEESLKDLLATFGLTGVMPWCVLSHINVQAEVEHRWPGTTALWFQSIAGSDEANATFDVQLDRMLAYAAERKGRYGLYFETGQGADFTNGHAQGMDMVLHESRKYGFTRLIQQRVAAARGGPAWVHVNDVAGFIGPEVFRTRDQLVRCCLEDLVMGKLHGQCIGLDVCSTLHMDVSLDDLDYCLDKIVPARPAYLMALPTKIDPMLGYLTTGFQDHVRLREKFGLKASDPMRAFFRSLGVLDASDKPGPHFGDPLWVHVQYRRKKGDKRPESAIREEGKKAMASVRGRGTFLAEGHGMRSCDLEPKLAREIGRIYDEGKKSIWAEFDPAFRKAMTGCVFVTTNSTSRSDYILHPPTGEELDAATVTAMQSLRQGQDARYDVQIVVSDGLNALSIMDQAQLAPLLKQLREGLGRDGHAVAPETIIVTGGRVRAGYRIGEILFGGLPGRRAVLHVIGERPGTGHNTISVYITCRGGDVWAQTGKVDHDVTRVVAGIANTALTPRLGVEATRRILRDMWSVDQASHATGMRSMLPSSRAFLRRLFPAQVR